MPDTRKGSKGDVSMFSGVRSELDGVKSELLSEMKKIQDMLFTDLTSARSELLSEMKKMQNMLLMLQSKITTFEGSLARVIETQGRQEAEIRSLKGDVLRLKEEKLEVFDEFEDRERRKPNLIISGIPEQHNGSVEERQNWDALRINSLLRDLGNFNEDIVTNTYRIGKSNSRGPRLLKVVCCNADEKRAVLLKAKELRRMEEYSRVFINSDLTPAQQVKNKALREDLKRRRGLGEDVVIQRGKIVKRGSLSNFH